MRQRVKESKEFAVFAKLKMPRAFVQDKRWIRALSDAREREREEDETFIPEQANARQVCWQKPTEIGQSNYQFMYMH